MKSYSIKPISSSDGIVAPSTDEVRTKLCRDVHDSFLNKQNVVHSAPTSLGKTHLIATTPWRERADITGGQPVIHFLPNTNARDGAYEQNNDSEATGYRLVGRQDGCPLASGEYDGDIEAPDRSEPSEWFNQMCDEKGLPLSVAHTLFEQGTNEDLPEEDCVARQQWDEISLADDEKPSHDTIFATGNFARVPSLIQGCNVVFDERPDFTLNIDVSDVRKSITSYLQYIGAPVKTYEGLVANHIGECKNRFYRQKFHPPDQEWFLNDVDAHVLTPGIVRAILCAERRCHDRPVGDVMYRFPDLNPYTETPRYRVRIRIVFDQNNNLRLCQSVPDFTKARCIIGLDAHPTQAKWKANTIESINFNHILSCKERQVWRRDERNLEIVQVGDNKYTWTNEGFNEEKVAALCSELRHRYSDEFSSGIISKEFETALRSVMEAAGIAEPTTIHFGMEESVNTFADETVGLVAGCISPSSEQIKDWLALLGKQATPKREVTEDYTGQEWIGPDADVAHELLWDVRERHVLQAVGRYGRSPSDPGSGATVYVLTDVLPSKWIDNHLGGIDLIKGKQRQILDTIRGAPNAQVVSEVDDQVTATRRHIYETIKQYKSQEWLSVNEGAGPYNGDLFDVSRVPECVFDS